MGSSLGPVFGKIIIAEMERVIVEPLISSRKLSFIYNMLMTPFFYQIKKILRLSVIRSIHLEKLKLTIDRFDDNNIYFLDITIHKNKTYLYYKPTHTVQCFNINKNMP